MSQKAIVEVELKTGAWEKFNASVKAHQVLLSKLPGQWGAVGTSIGKGADKVAKMVASAKNVKDSFEQAKTVTDKFVIGLKAADRITTSLVRGSASIAKNIASVTTSIMKWGAGIAISGILSLGGLFATFGALGKGIAGTRSESMQTGSTYGQTKAAELVYGNYLKGLNIQGLMSTLYNDINHGGVLMRRLNIAPEKWQGKGAGEVLPMFMQGMQDIMNNVINKSPEGARGSAFEGWFKNTGLNMDFGTASQIARENIKGNLNPQYAAQSQIQNLKMSDQNLHTQFAAQMDEVWENAKNKIAEAFAPLIKPMTDLSNSLIKSFGNMLADKNVQTGIKNVGKGIESTAKWLASPEGQQAITDGIANVAKFAQALYDVAVYIDSLIPETSEKKQQKIWETGNPPNISKADKILNDLRESDAGKWMRNKSDEKTKELERQYNLQQGKPAAFNQDLNIKLNMFSNGIELPLAAQAAFGNYA